MRRPPVFRSLVRVLIPGCLLAIALSQGSADASKRNKVNTKPPVEEEAPEPYTMEEREVVFGPIDEAFTAGRKGEVADLLVEVIDNAEIHVQLRAEAYARLGKVLASFDLPYSALVAYQGALETDAALTQDSVQTAIELADKVGDTAILERVFADNLGLKVSDATRSRMAYLAAREAHARKMYPLALASLSMVVESDPFFPEAKALEGVTMSLLGNPAGSLAPLQMALGTGKALGRNERFMNTVTINLGRAYYASSNFPRAIEYFAQVDRGSRMWTEAQFERSWAHFRLQDTNGVLSLLQTHDSPFMEAYYFPEASLLKVYSLFLMCKFPEATKEIDRFKAKYEPKIAELRAVEARDPADLFDAMAKHIEGGRSDLPSMISWRFEEEDRFNDSLGAVRSAEDEKKRLQNVSANPFSGWASDEVEARRQWLVNSEGRRIKNRAKRMADELAQMMDDVEISKLDMMDFERRLFQAASARGDMLETRDTVKRTQRIRKNERYWPWEGEYWADEVGYYRINSKPDCPQGMSQGLPQ
jgi:tetratricopeptide (TPR) repeat protein